jgi:23S rRNA (uracil1939-C5)-methyltransferase
LNNAKNCRFEAGDVLEQLDELIDDEQRFDCIVLNPPRKGCERDVLNKLVQLEPERIVYVSCSPQTLARDLDILSGKGYQATKVQPVEMFPQTAHVENVALLERKTLKTA